MMDKDRARAQVVRVARGDYSGADLEYAWGILEMIILSSLPCQRKAWSDGECMSPNRDEVCSSCAAAMDSKEPPRMKA